MKAEDRFREGFFLLRDKSRQDTRFAMGRGIAPF
jgi:hypothetical protein